MKAEKETRKMIKRLKTRLATYPVDSSSAMQVARTDTESSNAIVIAIAILPYL